MRLLIYSDSLMKHLPHEFLEFLQYKGQFSTVETKVHPGYTVNDLISNAGPIHQDLTSETILFLSSCQNDISKLVKHSGQTDSQIAATVISNLTSATCQLLQNHPTLTVFHVPLHYRHLNQQIDTRFPESKTQSYIDRVNGIIETISNDPLQCACHPDRVFAKHTDTFRTQAGLLSQDGLHYNADGKVQALIETFTAFQMTQ